MHWNQAVDRIVPYVVKIETPTGYGTGFLCLYNHDRNLCGIATAAHVVSDTDRWQQPMRIKREVNTKTHFIDAKSRVIYIDEDRDSAVILLPNMLEFPEDPIPLFPVGEALAIGTEVGWVGYPEIVQETLCFFSGTISAPQKFRNAYLIDGVAINGVSGGPVMHVHEVNGIQIVGTVSAYQANRITGDALPGLLYAQDVSHFHTITAYVKSIEEAQQKKQEYANQEKDGQSNSSSASQQPIS